MESDEMSGRKRVKGEKGQVKVSDSVLGCSSSSSSSKKVQNVVHTKFISIIYLLLLFIIY